MKGTYPGMRGIVYNTWASSGSMSYSALPNLGSSGSGLSNATAGILTGLWEGSVTDYATSYYCSRGTAFFVAPMGGNFSFLMSADDIGALNGTYMAVSGA